jgi:hypothetical protein
MAAPERAERPGSSFGEFGAAVVAEVCTPRFLRHRLERAIDVVFSRHDGPVGELRVRVTDMRVQTPRLINDDGFERSFAVVVRTEGVAEIGPRLIATTVDATITAVLTVRLRTFRPAIARIEIDSLTRDDLRIRVHPRGGLLAPLALLDAGSRSSWIADRALPSLLTAINDAVAGSVEQRQIDVLGLVRPPADGSTDAIGRSGELDPGEHIEWPVRLGELEQSRLRLRAGRLSQDEETDGADDETDGADEDEAAELELSVWDADDNLVDQLTLAAPRTAPDLGAAADLSTSLTGIGARPASDGPTEYRVRLTNHALVPLTYRVENNRKTVPGRRIRFAEFGEVLVRRGVDRETVARLVTDLLARRGPVGFEGPLFAGGTATARLADVTELDSAADERAFRLLLDLDVELLLGVGPGPLTITLRVGITLRVSTTTGPAQVLIRFDPVGQRDLRVIRGWHGRDWWIPTPRQLRARAATELNQRLNDLARDISVAELVEVPPQPPTGQLNSLRGRTPFTGATAAGEPGAHQVPLDRGRWIQAS